MGEPNVPPEYALYYYNPEKYQAATQWIRSNPARGGTNIKTPLLWAIETLNLNYQPNTIPFVVLITDGAVREEKEICQEVKAKAQNVRVLTFGIGQHCNWYFLKMLSLMTRGWSSGSLSPEALVPKMSALVDRASQPVLTGITLGIDGLQSAQLFPEQIPDLFVGGPLVIAGKFEGQFPPQISLNGYLPDGKQLSIPVRTDGSTVVPVSKVFVKKQLDQLIAEHWLNGVQAVQDNIVDISLNEQLPTPYTTMVAYEMDAKQKAKLEKEEEKEKKSKKKRKKKGPSGATIAKYAGGAVAITAGAVLVGSVLMTMQGTSGFGDIGVGGLDMGDVFGGDCCGDCCGDCGIFGDVCGEIGSCFGDCCGDIGGFFGDCCGEIGGALGDCSCFGEIIGGLGDCCGGVVDAVGNCPIGDICEGCLDILMTVLDAF